MFFGQPPFHVLWIGGNHPLRGAWRPSLATNWQPPRSSGRGEKWQPDCGLRAPMPILPATSELLQPNPAMAQVPGLAPDHRQTFQTSLRGRTVGFDRGTHFVDLGKMGLPGPEIVLLPSLECGLALPSPPLSHVTEQNEAPPPPALRCRPLLTRPAPILTLTASRLRSLHLVPGKPESRRLRTWNHIRLGLLALKKKKSLVHETALAATGLDAQPRLVLEILVGGPPATTSIPLPSSRIWHHKNAMPDKETPLLPREKR